MPIICDTEHCATLASYAVKKYYADKIDPVILNLCVKCYSQYATTEIIKKCQEHARQTDNQ